MNRQQDFIHKNVFNQIKALGYNEEQSESTANDVLTRYNRSSIKSNQLLEEARKFAKKNYGSPKK